MMFVQSLHGISHNKIEDTKEEHLELCVTAFDKLVTVRRHKRGGSTGRRSAIRPPHEQVIEPGIFATGAREIAAPTARAPDSRSGIISSWMLLSWSATVESTCTQMPITQVILPVSCRIPQP